MSPDDVLVRYQHVRGQCANLDAQIQEMGIKASVVGARGLEQTDELRSLLAKLANSLRVLADAASDLSAPLQ